MLVKQATNLKLFQAIQKNYLKLILLLCMGFIYHSHSSSLYANENADTAHNSNFKMRSIEVLEEINQGTALAEKAFKPTSCKKQKLTYYLYIADFARSFIEIPTANISEDSSTTSSKYLAGRAPVYNKRNKKVGTCSASFLCMQNTSGIYTDISNFISVDNGLIVTWFTPTTLINLELDSIIHSMVTECIVVASTKVGFNPFYGETFNLVVSSDDKKIYFKFSKR
jgi:hypothetical protein